MTDLVAQLVGLLEEARNQARHPDYDWPLCLLHEIDAALSAAKDGGWVAVPEVPTPEMLRAAVNAVCIDTQAIEEGDYISLTWDEAKDVFAAMLAARPLPNTPKEQNT